MCLGIEYRAGHTIIFIRAGSYGFLYASQAFWRQELTEWKHSPGNTITEQQVLSRSSDMQQDQRKHKAP
jgi:hypothetical protein